MLNLLSSFIKLFCLFWGIIVNSIIDSSNSIMSISEEITKSYVSSLELFIKNVSFIPMTLLIFVFFVVLGLYFERRNHLSSPSMSFFTPYFAKIRFFLTPSILSVFLVCWILLASFFQFYFSAIISFLLLLNLKFKSRYFSFFISFVIFSRLLWFFMPLNDIVAMTSFFRSFTCVFSLVGYLFFLRYHTFFILWISILLRLFLGIDIGIGMEHELGLRMHSGKIKIPTPTNSPTHTPPVSPRSIWNKYHFLADSLKELEKKSYIKNSPILDLGKELFVDVHLKTNIPLKDEFSLKEGVQIKAIGAKINIRNLAFLKNQHTRIGLLRDVNGAIFLNDDFLEKIKFTYNSSIDPQRMAKGLTKAIRFNNHFHIFKDEAHIIGFQRKATVVSNITECLNTTALVDHNPEFKTLISQYINGPIISVDVLDRDPDINEFSNNFDRTIKVITHDRIYHVLVDHHQPVQSSFGNVQGKMKKMEAFLEKRARSGESNENLLLLICVDTTNISPHNIKDYLNYLPQQNKTRQIKVILNLTTNHNEAIMTSNLTDEQKQAFRELSLFSDQHFAKTGKDDDFLDVPHIVNEEFFDKLIETTKPTKE